MTHIEIIQATPALADELVKIENACFTMPWSRQSLIESLQNECSHFYVALADGVAVGYIGVQIFSGEGYVTNVAVLPPYRRQGIARALIKRAMENELAFLTLEVRESNTPAIQLYASLGFEPVGKRPRFYREPEEDAVLMTKTFV
ncbi:MAG: ribosomal protein S18-alanine N-acetyltransferase [Eubacterium sp.]|nr:ribosomal protein S18-alanine N-acetyltransferase [Eubacterium sp.]